MINRINAVFRKARRWNLTTKVYSLENIADEMQRNLFQKSKRSSHCLNHLCIHITQNQNSMTLRPRGHEFELRLVKYDFSARSFIVNSPFTFR